jgi:hypothetical protein
MQVINFQPPQKYRPDIMFTNKDEEIILIVDIKATKLVDVNSQNKNQIIVAQIQKYLRDIQQHIPFAMLVNLEEINIFAFTNDYQIINEISLKTNDIFSKYDSEFSDKIIFDFYLETLVKSWLRDLSYHWNSDTPPAHNELAKIGLLPLLEGGYIYIQGTTSADTLY